MMPVYRFTVAVEADTAAQAHLTLAELLGEHEGSTHHLTFNPELVPRPIRFDLMASARDFCQANGWVRDTSSQGEIWVAPDGRRWELGFRDRWRRGCELRPCD